MTFITFAFAVFFIVTFLGHWALREERSRKTWLLIASYVFYAYWDWRFLGLIWVSTVIDYGIGLAMDSPRWHGRRKRLMQLSIVANLSILGVFKYFGFFVDSMNSLFLTAGIESQLQSLSIILPVGVSFFTFQTMSYTIDVYKRSCKVSRNFVDFALFVAFFPQLVAGPIVRARHFLPQLDQARHWANVDVRTCLGLFAVGYFKKAVIADNLAVFSDQLFANPSAFDTFSLWAGLFYYTVQLYCDFSGYTDMAIAIAGMFGYHFAKNFDYPYLAPNITDVWRRWHISMTSWFRDYIFTPMVRAKWGNADFKIVLLMLLSGLWHGAGWNFVVWGFLSGMLLVGHRYYRNANNVWRPQHLVAVGITFLAWMWTLVPFRGESWQGIWVHWAGLLGLGDGKERLLDPAWFVVIALSLTTVHTISYLYRDAFRDRTSRLHWLGYAAALGAAWAMLMAGSAIGDQPFLYFQF